MKGGKGWSAHFYPACLIANLLLLPSSHYRSLVRAWSNLQEGGGGSKKIPSDLVKQTKKHLTDLLRLPKPALAFLKDLTVPVSELSTSDMSTFFSHLGVKTPQYHQASVLHLDGSNFNDLDESSLDERNQVRTDEHNPNFYTYTSPQPHPQSQHF